jgi:hypothetical protein
VVLGSGDAHGTHVAGENITLFAVASAAAEVLTALEQNKHTTQEEA